MHTQGRTVRAWALRTAEAVGQVAAASGSGWSLVAAGGRTVHIVDETGKVRGRFKAGQPIRQLRANRDATVLTALAGEAVIYAFSVRGDLEWRVELGGAVTAFAMDSRGERFAAVSAGGWLYTYSPATRERGVLPVGWAMASAAVVDGEELRVLVAGESGRLALLGPEGKPQWQKDLECPIGPVCADAAGAHVFVPAHERGLLVFGPDGREAGRLRLEGGVVRAEAGPAGFPVMVELSDGRLRLVAQDSSTVWEPTLGGRPQAWAFGAEGTRLVVAEGGRSVAAYEAGPAEAQPAEQVAARASTAGRARPPETAEPVDVELPVYLEIENAMAGARHGAPARHAAAAPRKASRHLKWKKGLPARTLPVPPGLLRVSSDGAFAVAVLADGTVVGLDRQGALAARSAVTGPAEIVPHSFAGTVGVRAGRLLLVLDLATKAVREVPLGEDAPAAFGCSEDLAALYVLDGQGGLCAVGPAGSPLWRQDLGDRAESLLVSPDGRTVLVCDASGRFRYYDSEGGLRRKFRFAEAEGHRAVALGADFSAFVGPGGRLTVLDEAGRRVWGRRLFKCVTRVERLDGALAVYGEDGVCAAVEPRQDRVWEFVPPPGRALLRKPARADPVLVHAAGQTITVFAGYRRKLEAQWRCRCSGEVEQFDADQAAACVVALADGKLHRLEGGGS